MKNLIRKNIKLGTNKIHLKTRLYYNNSPPGNQSDPNSNSKT